MTMVFVRRAAASSWASWRHRHRPTATTSFSSSSYRSIRSHPLFHNVEAGVAAASSSTSTAGIFVGCCVLASATSFATTTGGSESSNGNTNTRHGDGDGEQAGVNTFQKETNSIWEDLLRMRTAAVGTPTMQTPTTKCEVFLDVEKDFPDGYTESDRFFQVLEYHRSLLNDYENRWCVKEGDSAENNNNSSSSSSSSSSPPHSTWPRHIPTADEIAPLEMDYKFCKKSPAYRDTSKACQNLQFRIATYYLSSFKNPENDVTNNGSSSSIKKKGYLMMKELAEHGHPDGMCLYGIIRSGTNSDYIIDGVDPNPEEAVVWWRRCVDFHNHIYATYELAVAMYTGDGAAENARLAAKLFRRAAHLGHAGAAYMLGEMLLDGVGVAERDRASALEWIVTAAELGHVIARQRVMVILQHDYATLALGDVVSTVKLPSSSSTTTTSSSASSSASSSLSPWVDGEHDDEDADNDETLKWVNDQDEERARHVLIERRYTIGGGSRNPTVRLRRQTKVAKSRHEGEPPPG